VETPLQDKPPGLYYCWAGFAKVSAACPHPDPALSLAFIHKECVEVVFSEVLAHVLSCNIVLVLQRK
jgi:hypothetical protein